MIEKRQKLVGRTLQRFNGNLHRIGRFAEGSETLVAAARKLGASFAFAFFAFSIEALADNIKLPPPATNSTVSVAQALKDRRSERNMDARDISPELLSGVLWAANGFNRPDKRTNATGLNKQEIRIYVCMKSGAYLYDARANELVKVCDDDLRHAVASRQAFAAEAPVSLLIAADMSDKFYVDHPGNTLTHYDAGIVSGNIYLYCAANGLATVCRGTMDKDALAQALRLPDTTILHLNHPIGYPRATR
ncbi:MAG: nitroreductase family protein [Kiritimatiellia bacterium]